MTFEVFAGCRICGVAESLTLVLNTACTPKYALGAMSTLVMLSAGHTANEILALQMCAALDEVEGQEPGIDARLTRLAAALDDRLEDVVGGSGDAPGVMGALGSSDMDDLEGLVAFARSAAALQPDGTRMPARRCQVCRRPACRVFCKSCA